MNVIILFDITGEDGGKWYVTINEGNLSIEEGGFRDPDLTLTVSASDYLDISTGKLNSQLAFMTGRLTATGDLGLAMKMPRIFKE
jgi:putative sterol carrier protein